MVAIVLILGIALGAVGSYFFYLRAVGRIDDRLDNLQQQMVPPTPTVEVKPADGKAAKGKKGH